MPGEARTSKTGRLPPACIPCRRRKSRCHTEPGSSMCTTCRAHSSECFFPGDPRDQGNAQLTRRRRKGTAAPARQMPRPAEAITAALLDQDSHPLPLPPLPSPPPAPSPIPGSKVQESPLALASRDDQQQNLHIVGPAGRDDSQVLADYLAGFPGGTRSARMIVPVSAAHSRPVLFTMVDKRPVGTAEDRSVSAQKLVIIEKLLEPYIGLLVDEYFKKSNACLPLLDEDSFRRQFQDDKDQISPALLACLYAHSLIYWRHSPDLVLLRCPDTRFIWNLANEALYSELHLSPGMSIISALLLNVGGRPNTSLIGNGLMLGSAVSMAYSLGLNRSPLHWDIPQPEKYLRMKIWWALLVNDRWMSLAHGTPPHISRSHHDVPWPKMVYFCENEATDVQRRTASVYIALVGLSDVLDHHLQRIYQIHQDKDSTPGKLEASLNGWVDSLEGSTRLIVLRGTWLHIPGAANLRLAYLTTRLLQQRIELETEKQQSNTDEAQLSNKHTQARRTAEEILMLTQELQAEQLGDFWLSITAFTFPATVNFLLRCALDTEDSPQALAQSPFFQIAHSLMNVLRLYQEKYEWDIGNVCLAQHSDIINKILAGALSNEPQTSQSMQTPDFIMPDASIMDEFYPSLWDPLQNAW
ncbi:hypothetical protein S40285_02692 [Stachybotrys chlorohalonatus IBT 40285]|uniref:Zn(2)-C6 fungal-type domain-containing protein n=1 Tax=Stachybotrys chlorohalonatus (strain IBT 40285) TaxID=1283841 RepID=A0A084QMV7_STAC4|nr:hypothetical protein S40285_02692 [Stachybotrys chlorohalonata IBT 40285]